MKWGTICGVGKDRHCRQRMDLKAWGGVDRAQVGTWQVGVARPLVRPCWTFALMSAEHELSLSRSNTTGC